MFLLYINDLPNISNKLKFYLFADDTNIFFECGDIDILESTVNFELRKLILWLNCNRLALNVSKTNFVIFSAINKPLRNVTILLGKQAIAQKDHVKYLGVLIDSKLTFKNHISVINKKISRTIGLMSKPSYYLNQKTLTMIYYGLIYPYLTYGVTIWGNANDVFIDPLFIYKKKLFV